MEEQATLCWKCKKAYGYPDGCAWSRWFKPVEGWEAIPTVISERETKSFHVISCPEFMFDTRGIPSKYHRMPTVYSGFGQELSIYKWAKLAQIPEGTMHRYLKKQGLTVEQVFTLKGIQYKEE